MLKFQVSSYSALDKIDVGVYIVTTSNFQGTMKSAYQQNWEGSLSFEKVKRYLPHLKSAIQVPIYVIGPTCECGSGLVGRKRRQNSDSGAVCLPHLVSSRSRFSDSA